MKINIELWKPLYRAVVFLLNMFVGLNLFLSCPDLANYCNDVVQHSPPPGSSRQLPIF